jgi:hypothetical protein
MSQRTLFKCDKCGGEWETDTKDCPQQVNISVFLNYGKNYPVQAGVYYSGTIARNQTWCRPCIEASGVVEPREDEKKPDVVYPTTEDVLVEMLERLGFKRE